MNKKSKVLLGASKMNLVFYFRSQGSIISRQFYRFYKYREFTHIIFLSIFIATLYSRNLPGYDLFPKYIVTDSVTDIARDSSGFNVVLELLLLFSYEEHFYFTSASLMNSEI